MSSTLDDFTPAPRPPHVKLAKQVDVKTADGPKRAGYWGRCPERHARVAVLKRHSHETRIRALDAYAISDSALTRYRAADVKHVLFVEEDTKDVYEYPIRDFIRGRYVPDKFLWDDEDDQIFVRREDAAHVWEGHADSIYLPRDAKTGVR